MEFDDYPVLGCHGHPSEHSAFRPVTGAHILAGTPFVQPARGLPGIPKQLAGGAFHSIPIGTPKVQSSGGPN